MGGEAVDSQGHLLSVPGSAGRGDVIDISPGSCLEVVRVHRNDPDLSERRLCTTSAVPNNVTV